MTTPAGAAPAVGEPRPSSTAAALIIGNEILGGKYADTNSGELITLLHEAGVKLRWLLVLPDEVDFIAREVRRAAATCDLVFTSGGIGPTHDDCTLAAVARAFEVPLVEFPELRQLFETRYGSGVTEAQLKMARLPAGSRLIAGGRYPYPLLVHRNVFILPGVPRLFQDKLEILRPLLGGCPVPQRRLRFRCAEGRLAAHLDAVVAAHAAVEIGSYPFQGSAHDRVEITFEAPLAELAQAAADELQRRVIEAGLEPGEPF